MSVFRVTVIPVGFPDVTIQGDFIAPNAAAASRFAETMVTHPDVRPIVARGFAVATEESKTDPRLAANYDGPPLTIHNGGRC